MTSKAWNNYLVPAAFFVVRSPFIDEFSSEFVPSSQSLPRMGDDGSGFGSIVDNFFSQRLGPQCESSALIHHSHA